MSWMYIKKGIINDSEAGPLSDSALLQLAYDGQISPSTLVAHPVHSRGQWITLAQVPAATKKYDQGKLDRAESKRKAVEVKEQAAQAAKQAAQQAAAASHHKSPIARFLLDGQPESVVSKLWDKITQFLTPSETIEYIAVQARPLSIAPDCAVITDRRFIVFHQKLLGQVEFTDYLWIHLSNARVSEGIMYSDVSFTTTDGMSVSLGYLPKTQARAVYRISQTREEEVMVARREMMIEERRAGSSNIVVNTVGSSHQPASSGNDDHLVRLKRLKEMLDAGLIDQAEYDSNKIRILNSL